MRRSCVLAAILVVLALLAVVPAYAQQTTGNIVGRITDEQKAAVPGVTVTATNAATGMKRTVVSDAEGMYRFTALPVGSYNLVIELAGFATVDRKGQTVTVGQIFTIDFELKVAKVAETVTVTGATPLVETTSSSVGGVVDTSKIESLPLNGRQFANLAMTIPGVGMGFHSDPTKSSQYSPQIAGGNGRNVNYQIDGGDNNDDTVGGLLQLFPLEAIQEFNMVTSRYKAEYGRSNGGVLSVVTKSGTNQMQGSWFTLMRDRRMNARTETETLNNVDKQYYRRYQFGGSFGGPIVQNRAHFFVAAERTSQTTQQAVNTLGLFPDQNGVYDLPMTENLFTAKMSASVTANQYLSVRYGRNTNAQVYGVSGRSTPNNWGDSTNKFNSINLNHNWVLGGSKLNEFIFQYADFQNHITSRSSAPQESFPNGVVTGYNSNTPQTTEQHKFQFRDDFSWHTSGAGLGHDFKTGLNFIYEPHLYITFNSGSGAYSFTHLDNTLTGPLSGISLGSAGAGVNLPMKQYGVYFQDDWRVAPNLTLNLGIRYDLVTGFAIDQSMVTNFNLLQSAGLAGRFNGVQAFGDWGLTPQEDKNNIQPRIGLAWDVHGNAKDIVRAGWGYYYDFGYTNANILFAALNTVGGQGSIYTLSGYTSGIRNPDGSFFQVGQSVANLTLPNEANPNPPHYNTHVATPRVLQPYTNQWSVGWSHEINPTTVVDIDYVGTRGHDLGVRWTLNTKVNGGARRFADLNLNPANPTFDLSVGASRFDGVNFGIRRRMSTHIQFNAWYTLSRADGLGGQAVDELTSYMVQDANHPFADVQWGPASRADARHKITVSAVIEAPAGITVSPIFRFRSALPLMITQGYDVNNDGINNDIGTIAFAFDGLNANNQPTYHIIGQCQTINCGRGAPMSQMNLRVSKVFKLGGRMHLEAIGEVFNLFNAMNPNFGIGNAPSAGKIYVGTASSYSPNTVFMVPTAYAGDAGQPEQRVGQLGFRFTF